MPRTNLPPVPEIAQILTPGGLLTPVWSVWFRQLFTRVGGLNGSVIIDNGSITTPLLADEAVSSAKLTDNSVSTSKLADNSVTTSKILDVNVTTAKMADNSVTNAKAAQMAAGTIKGNNTGSTANSADLTVLQAQTLLKKQVVIGTLKTTNVQRVAGGGYGSFNVAQTISFTASFSGKYKIYFQAPFAFNQPASGQNIATKIVNTVGSATENYRGETDWDPAVDANGDVMIHTFGIFTLTAGVAYTFELQANILAGVGTLVIDNVKTALGTALIAEQLE